MLVDPDAGSQRQLLGLLSLRGHRTVPVARKKRRACATTEVRRRFVGDAVEAPRAARDGVNFRNASAHRYRRSCLLSDGMTRNSRAV